MNRSVRRWVFGALAATVGIVALVFILSTRGSQGEAAAPGEPRTPTASPANGTSAVSPSAPNRSLSPSQAAQLASRLTSGDATQVQAGVVLPSGMNLPPETVQQLHNLAPLTVQTDTFRELGNDTATATAITATGIPWELTIAWQSEEWKVLDTKQVSK